MLKHPFIPKFYDVVENKRFILKLSDYIPGESLYDTIREIGLLSTQDTQFYAACFILLLEYLMTE